jgi:hypothetical protein
MVRGKQKADRGDVAAALLAKMEGMDLNVGFGSDFWAPPQGLTTLRILPPVGEMEFFFQQVGNHRLPGGEMIYCPHFTTDGEDECPICAFVDQLYKKGGKNKEVAKQLRVGRRYWMNIILRDLEQEKSTGMGSSAEGPKVFTPGVQVFGMLQTLVLHPDYGNIADEYEGFDIVLKREGERLETTYDVMPRSKSCQLMPDDDQMDEICDGAIDLSPLFLSNDPGEDDELDDPERPALVKLLPWDRMVDETSINPSGDMAAVQKMLQAKADEAETGEPAFPAQSAATTVEEVVKESRGRRRRRR